MDFKLNSYPLIGMIHLPSLRYKGKISDGSIYYAIDEAKKLEELGYSGVMMENFGDIPFEKSRVSDSVLIKMSIIFNEIKKNVKIPLGVNILRNATMQALSLATTLDLSFIRANIWESAYITDQGIIEGAALETIKLKEELGSSVKILADIHVKHAYPLGNFSILESAENALLRGKADAIIVSGISTGREPDLASIKNLSEHGFKPIIGSGLSINNIDIFGNLISGAIVGTSIKEDHDVQNPIDITLASNLIDAWNNMY